MDNNEAISREHFPFVDNVVTFSNETLPFVTGDSTSRAVYPWNCGIWFGWRAIKK